MTVLERGSAAPTDLTPDGAPARPDAGAPTVRIRDLRRSFAGRAVLGGVDLDVAPGEFVALLGASGSGKSTILRALAGLDPDVTGTYEVPDRIAVAFQEPRLLPWRKVWRNVALGLSGSRSEAKRRAEEALREVGLDRHRSAWPSTLSGGEAQRAALARSLVRDPQLLLLDEPFGALDALTRIKMHALLARLCAVHQPAVVLVTHDVDEALLLADRALVLTPRSGEDGVELGARIAVDIAIDVPHPRNRSDRRFQQLRRYLLQELGVDDAPDAALVDDRSDR